MGDNDIYDNDIEKASYKLKVKTKGILEQILDPSWIKPILDEVDKEYFEELIDRIKNDIDRGFTILPDVKCRLAWTEFPVKKIKVIIIGQDPYTTVGVPDGLSFSSMKAGYIPPSLKNIYKAIIKNVEDVDFSKNVHGSLRGWAEQGVLLLNSCLTTCAYNSNMHQEYGWKRFVEAMLLHVIETIDFGIALLWGKFGKDFAPLIKEAGRKEDGTYKIEILKFSHPSPKCSIDFTNCTHFKDVNTLLKNKDLATIKWDALQPPKK